MKLSFYAHSRQSYAQLPSADGRRHPVDEILIGDYDSDGSVGEGGEFNIELWTLDVARRNLAPKLCVFDDAYGSLLEFIKIGGLGIIERLNIRSSDQLSRMLVAIGMQDRSDSPLEEK